MGTVSMKNSYKNLHRYVGKYIGILIINSLQHSTF